jgi:hypothetical protein
MGSVTANHVRAHTLYQYVVILHFLLLNTLNEKSALGNAGLVAMQD